MILFVPWEWLVALGRVVMLLLVVVGAIALIAVNAPLGIVVAGALVLWGMRSYRQNKGATDSLERAYGTRNLDLIERYILAGTESRAHFPEGDETAFEVKTDGLDVALLLLDEDEDEPTIREALEVLRGRPTITPSQLSVALSVSRARARDIVSRLYDDLHVLD